MRWVRRILSAYPLATAAIFLVLDSQVLPWYLPKPTFISYRAVCRTISFSALSCFCCSFSLSLLPFPPVSVVAILSLAPPLLPGPSSLVCVHGTFPRRHLDTAFQAPHHVLHCIVVQFQHLSDPALITTSSSSPGILLHQLKDCICF